MREQIVRMAPPDGRPTACPYVWPIDVALRRPAHIAPRYTWVRPSDRPWVPKSRTAT
jgi:hypothetical protein